MKILKIKKYKGRVECKVTGSYCERFINLCKNKNIGINNIKQKTVGEIFFEIETTEFPKLREIATKTKSRVKIVQKRGIYFSIKKYKKRNISFIIATLSLILIIFFSNFIYKVEVVGNNKVSSQEIIQYSKEAGLHFFTFKNKNKIREWTNYIRSKIPSLSWMGIEFYGSVARITVVEKVEVEENELKNENGDIVANKSGIVKKIIAENGTAVVKTNSYVEKGDILISGTYLSEVLGEVKTHATGIIYIENEEIINLSDTFESEVKYHSKKKTYIFSIIIKDKEYFLKKLDENSTYDLISESQKTLFNVTFKKYCYNEYITQIETKQENEIKENLKQEALKQIEEKTANSIDVSYLLKQEEFEVSDGKVEYIAIYTVTELCNEFVNY